MSARTGNFLVAKVDLTILFVFTPTHIDLGKYLGYNIEMQTKTLGMVQVRNPCSNLHVGPGRVDIHIFCTLGLHVDVTADVVMAL